RPMVRRRGHSRLRHRHRGRHQHRDGLVCRRRPARRLRPGPVLHRHARLARQRMNPLPSFITSARGALFDLDGVLVDTARYHYLAWRRLATELGFDFSEADNERLKGVSRMRSLEILLEIGGVAADSAARETMAARKNAWYVDYIARMDASEILPGARD